MNLGEALKANLRNRRIALNLSQERVADRIGIQLRHYQGIEGGERRNVTLETLKALANALQLEPWQLLVPGYVAVPPRPRVDRVDSVVKKVTTRRRRSRAGAATQGKAKPRSRNH